jgi:hypothetical protein
VQQKVLLKGQKGVKMIKVVGMRVEGYVGKTVSGYDCNFTYGEAEFQRYVLMLEENGVKYELRLWQEEGVCGSGWRTASYGCLEMNEVSNFGPFSHVPEAPLILVGAKIENGRLCADPENPYVVEDDDEDRECEDEDLENEGEDEYDEYWDHPHADIRTNVFGVSYAGSDECYPSGEVWCHMSLFREA